MVNEAMLASSSGDSSVQFVELLDHGGSEEEFTPVFSPYKLVIYDGAGSKLGEQTLNPTGLRAAAGADREYLISTPGADSAFHVTGDESLTVQLPAGAGQACFEANPNPPAFSCLTWGTITKAVPTNSMGTGAVHGPVPANGESDQRLPNNTVVAAAPTPKARNSAGATTTGGGGGGGTHAFAGIGFAARSARIDRKGRARLPLTCPRGSGACSGRLALTSSGRHGRRLGSTRFRLAAGGRRSVSVKLKAGARRLLTHRRRLRARATVSARDASGRAKKTTETVVLIA